MCAGVAYFELRLSIVRVVLVILFTLKVIKMIKIEYFFFAKVKTKML